MFRAKLFGSFVAIVVATLASAPAFAAKSDSKKSRAPSEPLEKRFAVFYGNRTLEKSDWEPVEKQTGFGIEGEFWKSDWSASLLVTYFSGKSSDETEENVDFDEDGSADADIGAVRTESTEIGIGARKWLDGGDTLAMFVEGGAVRISVKTPFTVSNSANPNFPDGKYSDSGSTTGFWIGGGASYPARRVDERSVIRRMFPGYCS